MAKADMKMTIRIEEGGEIQIIQYRGKTGGFALEIKDLWKVKILGLNDAEYPLIDSVVDKKDAVDLANYWSELVGFPVVEYHTKYTTTTELIKQ